MCCLSEAHVGMGGDERDGCQVQLGRAAAPTAHPLATGGRTGWIPANIPGFVALLRVREGSLAGPHPRQEA